MWQEKIAIYKKTVAPLGDVISDVVNDYDRLDVTSSRVCETLQFGRLARGPLFRNESLKMVQ